MGNQQLYADLHVEMNNKTPAQVLGVLLSHATCNEPTFRNVTMTEEIRGLIITKHGLPENYLAPLNESEE